MKESTELSPGFVFLASLALSLMQEPVAGGKEGDGGFRASPGGVEDAQRASAIFAIGKRVRNDGECGTRIAGTRSQDDPIIHTG